MNAKLLTEVRIAFHGALDPIRDRARESGEFEIVHLIHDLEDVLDDAGTAEGPED